MLIKKAMLKSPEEIEALGYVVTYDDDGKTFSLKTAVKYPITVWGYKTAWFDAYHPVIDDVYSVKKSVIDQWPEIFKFKGNMVKLKADHLLPEGVEILGWSDDGNVLKIVQGENAIFIDAEMQHHWHSVYDVNNPIQRSLVEAIYSDVFLVDS